MARARIEPRTVDFVSVARSPAGERVEVRDPAVGAAAQAARAGRGAVRAARAHRHLGCRCRAARALPAQRRARALRHPAHQGVHGKELPRSHSLLHAAAYLR